MTSWALSLKLPSGECHKTSWMISQHWSRWWLVAVRQQAITWTTNVDKVLWCHMASPGHNVLLKPSWGSVFLLCLAMTHSSLEKWLIEPLLCWFYLKKHKMFYIFYRLLTVRWHGYLKYHDDVIKWKHFPRHWTCVRAIHWSPVDTPHKGQ